MTRFRNLAVGTVAASVAPALMIIIYGLFAATSLPRTADDWFGVGLMFGIIAGFSLAGFVLLGLPYVLWLRRRGWLSRPAVLAGSAPTGVIYFAVIAWLVEWNHEFPSVVELWPGVLLGLSAGFGFCVGAGPNNSFKPMPLRGTD